MAIEFNCPYCTSAIRVSDDAAGKKGTCPRCETPILVPVIEGQMPATEMTETPAAPATVEAPVSPPEPIPPDESADVVVDAGPVSEPKFPGPPTSTTDEFSVAEQPFVAPSEPAPSYARALKRRRKTSGLGIAIPILFGAGLISVVVFLWVQNRPTLSGELTAEVLADFGEAAGGIGRGEVADLPKEVVQYVIDNLQENPARLTSGQMETKFVGTRKGIEVKVFEGKETAFFRVSPRKNEDFNAWVSKNADALEKPRLKEFNAAVKDFFEEYHNTEGDVSDLSGYRDSMGLNATVSRVGYNMAAIVGKRAYRCVYEDAEQRLYFLLPKKTRQFELVGRQLDNGEMLFPGNYKVKVK